MEKAILLAIAASLCTATASVCQRLGARSDETTGFDVWLVFRLARLLVWLVGIASMILGFAFQLSALHYGALALVQPILALELLFVFGYLAVAGSRRVTVKRRDWLAAVAMSAGIGLFLRVASPSGGRLHAPGSSWWLALATSAVVLLALAVAFGPGNRPGASRPAAPRCWGPPPGSRGVSWPRSSRSSARTSVAVLAPSSPVCPLYALISVGAATLLLASHALAAGPLAASQPGFTILDPLSASLLGVFLFGEHIRTGGVGLAGEALTLAVVMAGASVLSHSCLIAGEDGSPSCRPAECQAPGHRTQLRELTLDPTRDYQPAGAAEGAIRNRQPRNPATRSPEP